MNASVTAKGWVRKRCSRRARPTISAVRGAQLLHAEQRDDVLQLAVMGDRRAHLLGEPVMGVADDMGIEQDEVEASGSTAGYMPSAAMARDSTIELSRWLKISATAGSVKSSAGT